MIANNLILTSSSRAKIAEVKRLFSMSAAGVRAQAPCVRYVLARREDNVLDSSIGMQAIARANAGLLADLLLGDATPAGFRQIFELRIQHHSGAMLPLARLFEIEGGGEDDSCRLEAPIR